MMSVGESLFLSLRKAGASLSPSLTLSAVGFQMASDRNTKNPGQKWQGGLLLFVCLFLSELTLLCGCHERKPEDISNVSPAAAVSELQNQENALSDGRSVNEEVQKDVEKEKIPVSGLVTTAEIQNSRCFDCHYDQYELWSGSFHHHAMDVADSKHVLGDFKQREFVHLAFDELDDFFENAETNHSDYDIKQFVAQWLQKKTENTPSPITGLPKPEPLVRLIIALSNGPDKLRVNVLASLSDEQRNQWNAEKSFLYECGPVRPDAISEYQMEITEFVKKLVNNDESRISSASTIGLKQTQDRFIMTLEVQNSKRKDFIVKYVLGVFPLQQYLTELDDGRIQTLPIAWNVPENKWYSLYPGEKIPPNDPLHWLGSLQNWNHMCADCHTTGYRKNFNPDKNEFTSKWNEMGVGCSACHANCYEHERKARLLWDRNRKSDSGLIQTEKDPRRKAAAVKKLLVRYGVSTRTLDLTDNISSARLVESCAPCHSRRHNLDENLRPNGRRYSDFHVPEKIGSQVYYTDGQFRDECFEYGSFTQSRMYAMGVRCTDCHDAHSLELKKPGNDLCTQCHRADYYDTLEHHHHDIKPVADRTSSYSIPVKTPVQKTHAKGPGMNCVDCHLPQMNFMITDRRYDHNIHIPRPQLTLDLGTPNACNLCHNRREKKENAAWAQHWIGQWYPPENGIQRGRLVPGEHYAYAFSEGMRQSPQGLALLEKVIRERDTAKVRDMVRAGAFDLLSRYESDKTFGNSKESKIDVDIEPLLKFGLTDPNDWVRRSAVSCCGYMDEERRKRYLLPVLNDPSRAVRSEAIRLLSSIDYELLAEEDRSHFDRVLKEYRQELAINADQGASWLNLGVLEQNLRQAKLDRTFSAFMKLKEFPGTSPSLLSAAQAELVQNEYESTQKTIEAYQKGIDISPNFFPLHVNLAMMYYQRGEIVSAEREFRKAIEIDSKQGESHYSLALLLAETERLSMAVDEFLMAVELLPTRYRVLYNCALALDRVGRTSEAIAMLERALALEPLSKECHDALNLFRRKNNAEAGDVK